MLNGAKNIFAPFKNININIRLFVDGLAVHERAVSDQPPRSSHRDLLNDLKDLRPLRRLHRHPGSVLAAAPDAGPRHSDDRVRNLGGFLAGDRQQDPSADDVASQLARFRFAEQRKKRFRRNE